jgi:hypothetical protein
MQVMQKLQQMPLLIHLLLLLPYLYLKGLLLRVSLTLEIKFIKLKSINVV